MKASLTRDESLRTLPKPIYLDYNATTPVDEEVLRAMLPFFHDHFGNPSSSHAYGSEAKEAVAKAREQVSSLIGAGPEEVIFTSGGSESDNHAIIGTALASTSNKRKRHIITSRTEHPAVIEACRYLEEKLGLKVSYLPVDKYCMVNPEDVEKAITDETLLVTIMHANNEVGTIEPVEKIGEITRRKGVLFHTDAAQSCGKIEVDVDRLNVDLLSLAGHKLYAPKGVGVLYVREGIKIDSFVHGAGQERGRRAGTENVPYIVGLGKACELAGRALPRFGPFIRGLRDKLHRNITDALGSSVRLNGHPKSRLPNTLNVSIDGIVGEELLSQMPEIAASTGSACHAGSFEPSKVLLEMGLSRKEALGALRLSLGRATNEREIDTASTIITHRVLHNKKSAIRVSRSLYPK